MMGLLDTCEAGPMPTTLGSRFGRWRGGVWITGREVGRMGRENDRFVTVDT